MSFNTAILYDVENLLKGYNFSQQMAANLSLKEIVGAIQETERLGQIAVQRAYANWSDPRLAIMRGEINDLGIDPIQVFGFSRDQKKNAADIQLAIDAIDLAHVRPALEVFVVVSGDGGFASLAKKLHEYGKTVIGCAYRSATNKTFHAVCDAFVWINDPEEEERQDRAAAPAPTGHPVVTDPRNVRLTSKIKKCKNFATEEVLTKTREVLNWYASDSVSRENLSHGGIFLPVVHEGVKFAVPGFQATRFGFAKFIEYLQYACKGTPLCVARPANSQAILTFRTSVRQHVEVLPDLDLRDLHSVEGYRSLLATGSPVLRLPEAEAMHAIFNWIAQNPPEMIDLGTIIESAAMELDGSVSSESAKLATLCLVSAEAFVREPEGVSLSEQKLTLQPDVRAVNLLLAILRSAVRKKVLALLGSVRDDLLDALLGENKGENGSAAAPRSG